MKKTSRRGRDPGVAAHRAGPLEWVREAWASNSAVLGLVAKFFVVLGILHLLLLSPPGRDFVAWLSVAQARAGAGVLEVVGIGTEVRDATIFSDSNALTVIAGCSALEVWFFLVAAIVAFPSHIVPKVFGILGGLFLVQALNSLRIMSLFWVGRYSAGHFASVHEVFWPGALNLAAILILGFWLAWISGRERRR